MLVQNVQTNTQFASGIFSISGEKTSGKADNAFAFSKLFDGMNKSGNVLKNNIDTSKAGTADVSTKQSQDTVQNTEIKTDTGKDLKNALKNVKSNEATEQTKATTGTAENAEEIDEAQLEKVGACLVQIVVTITEFFNITPEELQGQLDSLGMKASDLADPASLQQLFVSMDCGNDVSKLLTDQNLLDSCNQLINEISDILEEFGMNEEMIASTIVNTFGDESNFKLDLLGKKEADGVKIDSFEKKEEITGVNTENTAAPEKDGEKELTIEFRNGNEAKNDTQRDGKKDSRSESDSVNFADKFINNMIEKFNQNVNEVSGLETRVADLRNIADQILNQIKINLTADVRSLEIQLTPEHLGKVNVQIQENDGVITAKFQTENQVSKEAIESNIIQFKETLREQGLKVDSVEVTVSDFSFNKDADAEKGGYEQNEGKNRKHFTLDEINEIVDGPDLKTQSYIDDGTSTVSYVA
ncbi:MAG: flagellar hook-length control protein FliK [Lachnospiraceae bacterium]|nr:flagellar hook-length control protein FliK [Lachnospiraceae bacterium]